MSATCLLAWVVYFVPLMLGGVIVLGLCGLVLLTILAEVDRYGGWKGVGMFAAKILGVIGAVVVVLLLGGGLAISHEWAERVISTCPEVHR